MWNAHAEHGEDHVSEERQHEERAHHGPEQVQPVVVEMRRETDDSQSGAHGRHGGQGQGQHLQRAAAQE